MYEIKKNGVERVFGHPTRKLFSTYLDYLFHSFLLLMEFYRSSFGYAIIVNIFITYLVLLMQFSTSSKFI